jgi:glutathione S-transferase
LRGRVDAALAVAEQHFERHAFVTGDDPTVADLSMCGYLFFPTDETSYDLSASHPAVWAWLRRLSELPGWRGPYDLLPGPRFPRPVSQVEGSRSN